MCVCSCTDNTTTAGIIVIVNIRRVACMSTVTVVVIAGGPGADIYIRKTSWLELVGSNMCSCKARGATKS